MNIFVLDRNPAKAAIAQCDKHVVKMILETAQILCTAVSECGGVAHYRPTHKNHPCSIWARKTKSNFNWLKEHGIALCEEYTKRYGKIHKSQSIIESMKDSLIPDGELTPFVLAMPDDVKYHNDPVKSYREYYKKYKKNIAKWKHNNIPEWFSYE